MKYKILPFALILLFYISTIFLSKSYNLLAGYEQWLCGFQLSVAFVFFTLIGIAPVLALVPKLKIQDYPFIAFGAGQVLVIAYYYIRSLIEVPISTIELLLVAGIFIALTFKQNFNFKVFLKKFSPLYLIVLVSLITIASKEFPRTISMSYDPDIHSFIADYTYKIGFLPRIIEYGIEGFNYPAGFAVLNTIWMMVTGIDVMSMVGLSVIVQSVLGICVFLSFITLVLKEKYLVKISHLNFILAICVSILVYFSVFPFGYQLSIFHNQGTARNASLAIQLVTLGFCTWSLLSANPVLTVKLLFPSLVGLVLLFNLNPSEPVIGGLILGLSGIKILYLFIAQKVPAKFILLVLTSLIFAGTLFCAEPFNYTLLGSGIPSNSLSGPSSIVGLNYLEVLVGSFQKFFSMGTVGNLIWFANIGLYSPATILVITIIVFSLFIAFTEINRQSVQSIRKDLLVVLCVIVISMYFYFVFEYLFPSGSQRLLAPYYHFLIAKLNLVFTICLSGALFLFIKNFLDNRIKSAILLLLILSFALCMSSVTFRTTKNNISYTGIHRNIFSKNANIIRKSDLLAFNELNKIFEKYKNNNPLETLSHYPKVLVLNEHTIVNEEKWLFPQGAGRILPLYVKFPTAFYYGKGNFLLYTYENYKEKVCDNFDKEWLAQDNIRFIFVPSYRGQLCINNLEKLIGQDKVFYKNKGSLIIDLNA